MLEDHVRNGVSSFFVLLCWHDSGNTRRWLGRRIESGDTAGQSDSPGAEEEEAGGFPQLTDQPVSLVR